MPEDTTDEPRKLDLSTVQVAASALAAVSAAVFASWFGTAGTLIGAALGSVVATVGSAAYSYSLRRTADIARRKAQQVRTTGAGLRASLPRPRSSEPGADDTRTLPPTDAGDGTDETDGAAVAWWRRLDPRGKDLPWGRLALVSAAVLAVTLVLLTSFEGLTGRSVSDYTRGDQGSGTTVGNVFGGDTGETDDDRQPTQAPTPTPGEQASETPTDTASEEPSEQPSEEPSSEAPIPTPTPTLPATPTPSEDPGAAGGTPGATPSS